MRGKTESKRQNRKIEYFSALLLCICTCFVIFVLLTFRVDDMLADHTYVVDFSNDWDVVTPTKENTEDSLPKSVYANAGDEIILGKNIPIAMWGKTLTFYARDVELKVYFDDNLKYQFGTKDKTAFGRSPGAAWHFIEIPEDMSVGRIRIEMKSIYQNHNMNLHSVFLGNKSACIWKVYQNNIINIILFVGTMIASFLLFLLYLWMRLAKQPTMGMLYSSLVCMFMAAISICDCGVLQYFLGNQYATTLVVYIAAVMFPIPMMFFARKNEMAGDSKLQIVLERVGVLVTTTVIVLQVCNVMDFAMIKSFIFLYMILTVLYVGVRAAICIHKDDRRIEMYILVAIHGVVLMGLLGDLLEMHFGDSESLFHYSIVNFCFSGIAMAALYAKKVTRIFLDSIRAQGELYRIEKENIAKQNELLHVAKEATERANLVLDNYSKDLENEVSQKTEEIMRLQQKVIEGFANLIENRDEFTGQHVKRTSAYVQIILEGLMEREHSKGELAKYYGDVALVRRAAPLHDIGKIIVPDSILSKPGRLTEEEFEIIKEHTVASDRIIDECLTGLESRQYIDIAKDMAIYHHEKFDGSGYPKGLKGRSIPLCARIMAVADVFDALISKRSYKEPMSYDEAFQIIEESSGTHFDSEIVEVFMERRKEVEKVTEKSHE